MRIEKKKLKSGNERKIQTRHVLCISISRGQKRIEIRFTSFQSDIISSGIRSKAKKHPFPYEKEEKRSKTDNVRQFERNRNLCMQEAKEDTMIQPDLPR